MILILSYKDYEQGTDPISEWLLYYKYPFRKITIEDFTYIFSHFKFSDRRGYYK